MEKEIKKITVAEIFSSIQGEGPTMGYPSIFLRLAGCNLLCGGKGTEKDKELHNGAKWRCDSIEVWRKGHTREIDDLAAQLIAEFDILERMKNGWRLIITGGEPLMQGQAIVQLLEILEKAYLLQKYQPKYFPFSHIEIETNGTIFNQATNYLAELGLQFNVSPKLASSGETLDNRYINKNLSNLAALRNSYFKFVVANLDDLLEVIDVYGHYNRKKIWLMPAASDITELQKQSIWLVNQCMIYNFKFSSRLQVAIWNETTGV